MLLSMTGFGRATAVVPGKKINIELKSINSKQFDMQSRVPSLYREVELEMRRRIAARLQRGKVDLVVTVENIGSADSSHSIDLNIAAHYKRQIEMMSETLGLPLPVDWHALLMRMPDVMGGGQGAELDGNEQHELLSALDRAIEALMSHRREEGKKLEDFFAQRLRKITELLEEIPQWEKERVDRIYGKLEEALAQVSGVQLDRGRLEQEMIFYIEKLDVNEERQRLAQHLLYFAQTMALPVPGQGKKLGFISQEMGREINTLGSKSNHAEMQRHVVMMKDELEQIKEQVLNVM